MLFIGLAAWLEGAGLRPWGWPAIYLIFPCQTVATGCVIAWFWRDYPMAVPRKTWVAGVIGALVFGLWIAPQALFHQPARLAGFDPSLFSGWPGIYWAEVVMRFVRLVVVVPLLEEVFWRGLLLRLLINENFESVPFGTYGRLANWVVAGGFMLEHAPTDWPAALAAGILYNLVAYRTRSLSSCVVAHGLTNALLGLYIMQTRQWGFW